MTEPVAETLARPAIAPHRHAFGRLLRGAVTLAVLAALVAAGYVTRERWLPFVLPHTEGTAADAGEHAAAAGPSEQVMLSEQAQKNLRLTAKPLTAGAFWKTISVPGMVIDRPGFSDRGVVAPVTGIVNRIHKVAGDTTRPGEVLFTVKLLSESLHLTQTELFKTTQDITLAQAQRKRLASAGAVPEARLIEIDSQVTRLEVAAKAYRQELLNRGLLPAQIDGVAGGTFVGEMPIVVPPPAARSGDAHSPDEAQAEPQAYEVQDIKVELGQQVQAGQTLCLLSNHQLLAVEGQAFRDELPLLEKTYQAGWPVEIDFGESGRGDWDAHGQTFRVCHIANTIDPQARTFHFHVHITNESRAVAGAGHTQTLWRFRPGQRVRLLVRVEKLDNVFVLPADAVAREGAETYVFRQNGDVFDRKPVQVVYQDRTNAVVANDGSVLPGVYVAQTGAAQLNRMVKSQSGTVPKGFHVHADGSVHMGSH